MKKNGVTLVELAVVVSIFFIMILALTPFVRMAKMHANQITCASNLRRISIGLHKYALDHNEAFPPDLKSLYPDYVDSESAFRSKGAPRLWTSS